MTVDESSGDGTARYTYCSLPDTPPPVFTDDVSGPRLQAIVVNDSKWLTGTTLSYYFFDRETDGSTLKLSDGTTGWRSWLSDEAHRGLVRSGFERWHEEGIGLAFREVNSREDADIRIG